METKDLPREKELPEMKKFTNGEKIRRCIRILVVFSIFRMTNAKKVSYDAEAPISDDTYFTTQPTEQTVMERKIAELQGQVS